MKKIITFAGLVVFTMVFVGCNSIVQNEPQTYVSPDSKLSQVHPGMTEMQVENILGKPQNIRQKDDWKVYIPFAEVATDDFVREYWIYKNIGQVEFSKYKKTDQHGTVVKVIYNPNESDV